MKKNDYIIRLENPCDYRTVETITREAFWNLSVPGCDEHYYVHVMRSHADFIPELDLVLEVDGKIIGNVMYTKCKLTDEIGEEKPILSFGPVCILPEYQRKGYGKALLEHSFEKALELGYDTIVIFGNPDNYVARGFKSCKKYNVCLAGNVYPTALLVKELRTGVLSGKNGHSMKALSEYFAVIGMLLRDLMHCFRQRKNSGSPVKRNSISIVIL